MGFVVFHKWNLPPILPKKVKMFQNERFVIIIKKTKTMVICRLILGIFCEFQNFQISRFQIPENLEILWKLLHLTNCKILGIFPTQFWSLSLIFCSEFLNFYFPGISRFQIFWNLESGTSRKMIIQKFWLKNQTQWPKLSGKNT